MNYDIKLGTTMWEIYSKGQTPYQELSDEQIPEFIFSGKRLQIPSLCPQVIGSLMTQCWLEKVDERPSFAEIAKKFPEASKKDSKIDTPTSTTSPWKAANVVKSEYTEFQAKYA